MSVRNLESLFAPRSVAVIGASNREHSVGAVVTRNLLRGGLNGPVAPVNPKYEAVAGVLAVLKKFASHHKTRSHDKIHPLDGCEVQIIACKASFPIKSGETKEIQEINGRGKTKTGILMTPIRGEQFCSNPAGIVVGC